ncbi:MAG: carbamoyltransferase HypF, partial [Acidobacteria bacterium]|nr:carbamoyltransferase HypF [Acidobacteriota bacterium]
QMLARGINAPMTSSAGRLFDAVAAIAGVRDRVSFEGQAAARLEALAGSVAPDDPYPFELVRADDRLIIDTRPLVRGVVRDSVRGVGGAVVARRFHSTLVEIIVTVCTALRRASGLDAVALSGGVFVNELLTSEADARLRAGGFHVYRHRVVPPNDGGLSLGQLAVAAAQTSQEP